VTGLPSLLFDLDGTLVDSLPGICGSINDALIQVGRSPIAESAARAFVGKPLASVFEALLESTELALVEQAVTAYRHRFDRSGISEGCLFPGVEGMLRTLDAEGYSLRIVTAKPSAVARQVLTCFGIERFFDDVHGPTLDDRHVDKAHLVLAALQASDSRPDEAVMIGDRADDVLAARAHGVQAVAAAWGYGSRAELVAAGPAYVACTIAELLAWVRRLNRSSEATAAQDEQQREEGRS
jgi:phosphoglycolate phosphatase